MKRIATILTALVLAFGLSVSIGAPAQADEPPCQGTACPAPEPPCQGTACPTPPPPCQGTACPTPPCLAEQSDLAHQQAALTQQRDEILRLTGEVATWRRSAEQAGSQAERLERKVDRQAATIKRLRDKLRKR